MDVGPPPRKRDADPPGSSSQPRLPGLGSRVPRATQSPVRLLPAHRAFVIPVRGASLLKCRGSRFCHVVSEVLRPDWLICSVCSRFPIRVQEARQDECTLKTALLSCTQQTCGGRLRSQGPEPSAGAVTVSGPESVPVLTELVRRRARPSLGEPGEVPRGRPGGASEGLAAPDAATLGHAPVTALFPWCLATWPTCPSEL